MRRYDEKFKMYVFFPSCHRLDFTQDKVLKTLKNALFNYSI